jgi:hypothetical protein
LVELQEKDFTLIQDFLETKGILAKYAIIKNKKKNGNVTHATKITV